MKKEVRHMKQKIISVVLGLCLAVGMAAPTFADINSSSLLGAGEDATKIVRKKDSLTVKNGDTINILDYITVLVSNSQLASHDSLIFDIEDNGDLAFSQDGSEYTANESKGTATAVIKSENEKVVTKIKLNAAKSTVTYATGFKYENPSYSIAVNGAASTPDGVMKLVPTPSGAVFSKAQVDEIVASVAAVNGITPTATGTQITSGAANGQYSDVVIKLAGTDLASATVTASANQVTRVDAFTMGATSSKNARSATTKVAFVQYALKSQIASKGTLTIKVGQTVDLLNNVKQGPSAASTEDDVSFSVDYYNEAAETFDYATIEGTEITGVHTGKVKIIASLAGGATTSFVVNVVDFSEEAGSNEADAKLALTFSIAKTAVGGSFKLNIKNAPVDAKITYFSYDDKVASIDANGVVKGVGEGKTKVVAEVDGTRLYCEVTVVPAASQGGTNVPATGVATLSPLF